MNKTELAEKVAENHELTGADAQTAVDAVFDSVSEALKAGEKINIPGFGIFQVQDTAARTGRNPKTGESIQIPAGRSARFKPSAVLKRELKATL